MNVLSLFDGMSCGKIALKELNINVDKYYASEIDRYAIQQSTLNFPDTIHLGSVTEVDVTKLEPIDLLIGGSPCQSFSFAGKRKGMSTKCEIQITKLEQYLELKESGFEFEGQSYLFWEYMRILTDIRKYNPDVLFLLENVEMGAKWERILSEAIGVYGVHINSALVSAQNRKRIYWFGQNRERFYYSENYCYLCDKKRIEYEKKIRGIQNSTQRERKKQILGNSQRGQSNMCNMQQGVLENRTERNNENMLGNLSKGIKKDNGQKSGQDKKSGISEKILSRTQNGVDRICEELSKDRFRKTNNEESRFRFIADCQKENENSFKEGDRWNYCVEDGRFNLNPKYETYMYCVCCGKELDHRPYRSVISYGDKRDNKSPDTLSKMQFEEARQNNGRIFDIYSIGVKGQESMFGETIADIPQPKDRGILLKDILETEVDEKYYLSEKAIEYLNRTEMNLRFIQNEDDDKGGCVTANYQKGIPYNAITVQKDYIVAMLGRGENNDQQLEPNYTGKTNTITSVQKDNLVMQINPSTESGGKQPYQQNRVYDTEGISPALCANKADLLITGCDYRSDEGFRFRENGKSGTLAARARNDESCGQLASINSRIRRLTPTECSRLQTIPDWYKWIVSDTQQYKLLGNGWTVETIKHIFQFIKCTK